jgi:dCTP diphosphatase
VGERQGELDVVKVQQRLRAFAAARDWEQFHSPKNLTMALAAEVGELLEILQWLTEEQSRDLSESEQARVTVELADIQIYLLRIADVLRIGLPEAVDAKILDNERRYPIELSKGNAVKYSQRGSE